MSFSECGHADPVSPGKSIESNFVINFSLCDDVIALRLVMLLCFVGSDACYF